MQLNYILLGQRIQKIRKSKHISQAVLSAMIDKSAGYISYLECGTKAGCLDNGRAGIDFGWSRKWEDQSLDAQNRLSD